MNWRACTTCKKEIEYKKIYYVCNVSTCTRKRAGFVFCSVSCWDAHVPTMRHKESWAVERRAPTLEQWQEVLEGKREDMTYPEREKPKEEVLEAPRTKVAVAPILRKRSS